MFRLFCLLLLTIVLRSRDIGCENVPDSPLSESDGSVVANSNLTANFSTSWNDHVDQIESEVLQYHDHEDDANKTIRRIYEKESQATEEMNRLGKEIKRIEFFGPILVLVRAAKPFLQNLIAKIG